MREEAKRKMSTSVIRLTNMPPRTPQQMKMELEQAIQLPVKSVAISGSRMIIVCGSDEVAQAVLGVSGSTLEGKVLKATKVDLVMTGDEICSFITDRLETEERVQTFAPVKAPEHIVWGNKIELKSTDVVKDVNVPTSEPPPPSPRPAMSTGIAWVLKDDDPPPEIVMR